MCPECDAATGAVQCRHTADYLDQKPVTEHEYRWHRDGGDEEAEEDQGVNAGARIEQCISPHDTPDGARCAHHGDDAVRVGCDLSRSSSQTTKPNQKAASRAFSLPAQQTPRDPRPLFPLPL